MGRGDSSMPSVVMSGKRVLPDKARVSPRRVAPTVAFADVVARAVVEPGRDIESLRGRMPEAGRQAPCRVRRGIEGLSPTLCYGDASRFESLLAESFS
jgi:hypothetical protein